MNADAANVLKFSSDSSVPSLNVSPQKLQDCPKECDREQREAKFAFRSTDLESWQKLASASPSSVGGTNANSDPIRIQHWAVVIHFPEGDLTFVFEAAKGEETGKLEGYRARFVDKEVFEKAIYFDTFKTSPRELLEMAKQVKSNGTPYNLANNNCQTWLVEFVNLVSPNLLKSLTKMIDKLELRDLFGWTVGTYIATAINAQHAAHSYYGSPLLTINSILETTPLEKENHFIGFPSRLVLNSPTK